MIIKKTLSELSVAASKLTGILMNSASADAMKLCVLGDEFMPYGADTECRTRYVRKTDSPFRSGLRNQFVAWKQQGQKGLANDFVPQAIAIITNNTLIPQQEAADIVWKEYAAAMGHFPPPKNGGTLGPVQIDHSRTPGGVTPIPLPQWPGLPGDNGVGPVPMPPLLDPSGPLDEGNGADAQPAPSEEDFPWLLVGLGAAVVLGGGIYLMTRKKKRR